MKKIIPLIFTLFCSLNSSGQGLSAPVAEGVYGGLAGDIETWSFHSDSIYCVVSTFSPNSIFWAKASRNASRSNLPWEPLASADADDGFGSSISNIEIHQASNTIFFLSMGTVYSTSFGASSATAVDSLVKDFLISGDTMALVKNNPSPGGQDVLDFGAISSSGVYSKSGSISLLKNYTEPPQMILDPADQHLHLLERGASPHIYRIVAPFYNMSSTMSLSSLLNAAPSIPNIEWRVMGFAPNGDRYMGGQPPLNNPTVRDRHIAWTSDNGITWGDTAINTPGPIGGIVGPNMLFNTHSGSTALFLGNAIEDDISLLDNWYNPGRLYIEELNRANDGVVKQDPIDGDIVYHTTNIGMGYSTATGDSIFAWNEGLTAVQVNDIDMNRSFSTGWVASKSGVRQVTDYKTSPVWSEPKFPQFDGAPYTAVAMTPGADDTVFVGNQRIYRTQNGGTFTGPGPMDDGWSQVFTPEIAPWNFNRINAHCTSIAVAPDSANIIMAGYSIDFGDKGGCFYSLDGGNTWAQLMLNASAMGQDADVNDVVLTREAGNIVAYIGLASDPVSTGQYGLFRAELSGSTWTLARDGSFGATDAIIDLELNESGDSLFVLNYDPGLVPVSNVFIKDLSSGSWTNFPGPNASGEASAITDGDGFVFISLDEKIYINSVDGTLGWSLGYAYPVGTEINVLFYDELLVGTGTGLYAHDLDPNFSIDENTASKPWQLYPNPVRSTLRLNKAIDFKIYDLFGRIVYQSKGPQKQINLAHWQEGLYILRSSTGESQRFLIKH